MKIPRQNVDFLIARLKELEHIIQVCSSSVFSDEFDPQVPIVIKSPASEELSERLITIISDCDTAALNRKAVRAAEALGDSAYLLLHSIEEGSKVIVAYNPGPSDEENFLSQYYITPPKLNEEQITLVQDDFINARDYARKALELIKPLARSLGFDIESLELQGELYI